MLHVSQMQLKSFINNQYDVVLAHLNVYMNDVSTAKPYIYSTLSSLDIVYIYITTFSESLWDVFLLTDQAVSCCLPCMPHATCYASLLPQCIHIHCLKPPFWNLFVVCLLLGFFWGGQAFPVVQMCIHVYFVDPFQLFIIYVFMSICGYVYTCSCSYMFSSSPF